MTMYNPMSTNLATVTLTPPEVAPVCSGGRLELMCTTGGSALDWRFRVFLENETTISDLTRLFFSSDSARAAMSLLMVNSTLFNFSRTSARDSLPVESTLVIGPVSDNLNGTVVSCVDLESSNSSSTTVVTFRRDSLPGMQVMFLKFLFYNLIVMIHIISLVAIYNSQY